MIVAMMFRKVFGIFLTIGVVKTAPNERPVVKTPLGSVMGHYIKSLEGRTALAFEGIPYAKPPIGDLRFKEPQPVDAWSDVIMANTTYVCLHFLPIINSQGITGDEDCLYLYIYIPQETITSDTHLNVIVHIHGGAFMLGAPRYFGGPDNMLDKDVVYVSFNYRLGILGFLSTEDETVPGNNGLKDQVMALKWIKDNIKYFGGNPNSVTITGLSAGGASVHYHYLSPMSKGLFHRGFSQSGTALNMWALTEKPLSKAQRLATLMNCSLESTSVMIGCLREKNAEEMVSTLQHFFVFIKAVPFTPFGPVVEKGENAFLPDHPYKILLDGKINDLPWVVSNTKDEGIYPVGFFVLYRKLQELDKRWNELMPAALDYNDTADEVDKVMIAEKVKERYLNNGSLSANNVNQLVQLFTDRLFLIDGETAVRLHAKVSKSPVYYYFMEYQLVMKTFFSGLVSGTAHSHDGRLLFYIVGNPKVFPDGDKQMKNIFIDFLYDFATKGKPNFKGVEWKPVEFEGDIKYMHIGGPDDIEMKSKKELASQEFWNSLPIKENSKLYGKN